MSPSQRRSSLKLLVKYLNYKIKCERNVFDATAALQAHQIESIEWLLDRSRRLDVLEKTNLTPNISDQKTKEAS